MTIIATSSEIPAAMDLIGKFLPDLNIAAYKPLFAGVTAEGSITLKETLTPTETAVVTLTITPK